MDRLFLDANVLFSAAWSPKTRVRVLWDLPEVELISSTQAVEEAWRNLALSRPAAIPMLERIIARVTLAAYVPAQGMPRLDVHLPEDDWFILAAAIIAKATCLLTGDRRHFGHMFGEAVGGGRVMLPSEYLQSRRS